MTIQKVWLTALLGSWCLGLSAQQFDEVSLTSGIDHRQVFVGLMGGGVALFDYDMDGDIDMYLTGGSQPDKLFRNEGNFVFEDVSDISGIGATQNAKTMGVAAGDFNNDGYKDLFITTTEDSHNLLLFNSGQGAFSEVSQTTGITDSAFSISATLGDYNLDGLLDIYVANYVETPAFLYDAVGNVIGFDPTCYANTLYKNNGDNTFSEVAGITDASDEGCGLATVFTDFDNDGDLDIYVANDFGEWHIPNTLLKNRSGQDRFEDVSAASGANGAIYGMGVAVGDYDEDGDLDYYVTNLGRNLLLQNSGEGTFIDVTTQAGVEDTYDGSLLSVGWGTAFIDYDNDSYLDLLVNNGEIPTFDFLKNNPLNKNKLYRNNQGATFEDVSEQVGFDSPFRGRGLAYGDLDNDGDLDVVATVVERYPINTMHTQVYRNNAPSDNAWIKINLAGKKNNRDGYGAHVKLYVGKRQLTREVDGGSSHVSQHASDVHFGLGEITEIDSVIIVWPGGNSQHLGSLETNSRYIIEEESSTIVLDETICGETAGVIVLDDAIVGNEYYLKNIDSQQTVDGPILCEDGTVNLTTEASSAEIRYVIFSNNPEQNYLSTIDTVITKNQDFQVGIIEEGSMLKATAGKRFLWYLNDELLEPSGAQIAPTVTGQYHVEAVNEYGCVSISESINVVITSVAAPDQSDEIKIYPNPSEDIFKIQHIDSDITKLNVAVYDLLGKMLTPLIKTRQNEILVDMAGYRQGIYILSVPSPNGVVKRILIRK